MLQAAGKYRYVLVAEELLTIVLLEEPANAGRYRK
jgi:hypothetical protein